MKRQRRTLSKTQCWLQRTILVLFTIGFAACAQISLARQLPMIASAPGEPCQLSLDQDVMDYGSFTAGQLSRTSQNVYSLVPRYLRISISCQTPTSMALKLTGPSSISGDGTPKFASGGSVRITLSDAIMDGETIRMHLPSRNGSEQRSVDLLANDVVYFSTKDRSNTGMNLSARVRIEPMVEDGDTRVADQTIWASQLRFDLVTP